MEMERRNCAGVDAHLDCDGQYESEDLTCNPNDAGVIAGETSGSEGSIRGGPPLPKASGRQVESANVAANPAKQTGEQPQRRKPPRTNCVKIAAAATKPPSGSTDLSRAVEGGTSEQTGREPSWRRIRGETTCMTTTAALPVPGGTAETVAGSCIMPTYVATWLRRRVPSATIIYNPAPASPQETLPETQGLSGSAEEPAGNMMQQDRQELSMQSPQSAPASSAKMGRREVPSAKGKYKQAPATSQATPATPTETLTRRRLAYVLASRRTEMLTTAAWVATGEHMLLSRESVGD